MRPRYHRRLIISKGEICNENGESISISTSRPHGMNDRVDWGPFCNRLRFEVADLLFQHVQMSGSHIDEILQLWTASLLEIDPNASGPFRNHWDLYETIDHSALVDNPWVSFTLSYGGERPQTGPIPTWMTTSTEIWYRDPRQLIHGIIGSPDFQDEIDYVPYHEYVGHENNHRFHDFFSGDWVWKQAVSTSIMTFMSLST